MRLYVTPKGVWTGTQADAARATREEGSKPGSWKAVEVPTDKAGLLLFLNKGWKGPTKEEPKVLTPEPVRKPKSIRWRVYGGRHPAFVMSSSAEDAYAAVAEAAATLTARPVRAA